MAGKGKGPIKGTYVPVKLPWVSAARKQPQFVSMKKPVAEFLKLDAATNKDLEYQGEVRYRTKSKDGKPGEIKTVKVTRIRRPGHRIRSVQIIFGDRKTGTKKKQVVGTRSCYSCNFPVTSGVPMSSVREEFMTGKWKSFPVIRIVNTTTGQGYPIY